MIKSIIVEDEPNYSDSLIELLSIVNKEINETINVIKICRNVNTALAAIVQLQPEIIFLDIDLDGNPNGGFDIINGINKIDFEVIFTTAHVDRNIRNIRVCGLDYIVKPYILEEVIEAVQKFRNKTKSEKNNERAATLKGNLQSEKNDDKTIWIPTGNNYVQIELKNILYCESDNQYTYFFVSTEQKELKKIVSTKGIGEWEKDLDPFNICRIHKEHLVNIKHVTQYIKGEGGEVILTSGHHLNVSKTGRQKFLNMSGMK